MQLTIVLLLMFAMSIGIATFIENDYGSEASKIAIYNATWFEILLLVLAINLIGSLFTHKLWKRKKIHHIHHAFIICGYSYWRSPHKVCWLRRHDAYKGG